MGLGGGPRESDEYEWVRLADLPAQPPPGRRGTAPGEPAPEPLAEALTGWLAEHPLWTDGAGPRILLVDLDNLRADPMRWRARMALVVALARQADRPVLAGQGGAVARARPHLAEFARAVRPVPDGSDLADHELLRAAALTAGPAQVVVVSNDGIFAELAAVGPLVVISPGRAALSSRLQAAADRVIDLTELEEPVAVTTTAGTTTTARITTARTRS
jgi:hypothetical protein